MVQPICVARSIAGLVAVVVVPCCAQAGTAFAEPESVAPADFVALRDIDPTILQDIRYLSAHNFTGSPTDGYRVPMCIPYSLEVYD